MARKRGFIAADPTAWKAIGWADKELAKKDIRPKARAIKEARARLQEQGFDCDPDKIRTPKKKW